MALTTHALPFNSPKLTPKPINRPPLSKLASSFNVKRHVFSDKITAALFRRSGFRIKAFRNEEDRKAKPKEKLDKSVDEEMQRSQGNGNANIGNSFLVKLAIFVAVAAIATAISINFKGANVGSTFGVQFIAQDSSSSIMVPTSVGSFTFKAFGYTILLPEYTPGWVYFWLLMAAACGLFISEEALNIWVGITIARMLTLDGTWKSFVGSLSKNSPYIFSTIFWVYWGVCVSDMIPYYIGRIFRQSGASDDACSKLGIDEQKVLTITHAVRKYGNLIGVVERFSIGVRNPTAFLAGALGISPECFFAGVCCGGLITLPLQLGIGFLLRERPVFALATVATVVGIWTVLPYIVAASTALFFYVRRRQDSA